MEWDYSIKHLQKTLEEKSKDSNVYLDPTKALLCLTWEIQRINEWSERIYEAINELQKQKETP